MEPYSKEQLEKLADQVAAIAKEMGNKLAKYDAKTAALIYVGSHELLKNPVSFPDDYSHKKLNAAAANKKLDQYLETIRNPEKYPLDTRLEKAAQMKKIIDEGQAKIKALYAGL